MIIIQSSTGKYSSNNKAIRIKCNWKNARVALTWVILRLHVNIITIEYYRPRKWSDMDLASFCPFGWRLGAGDGPVSRGDNPQTAHLATRIKSFIVIKPRFEGDGYRGTWRCRAVVMSHFPSRVWGRKLELAMYMDHNYWGRETIHQ